MATRTVKLKQMILALLLLTGKLLNAQVLLIPETPTSGVVLRQQLWSVVLNNLSGQPRKAVLRLVVTDRQNSQTILEGSSGLLMLNTGIKRVMYHDLSPITYTVTAAGFGMDRQLGQPVPPGEYIVCYNLMEEGNKNELLASECIKVYAEPLAPPQLVLPENESVITTSKPVFNWTPPAPVNMFSSLGYDVVVSPLYDRQSPEEALQRNIPVLTTMTGNNALAYPSSFTSLEAGKTYVWQVAAKDAGRFAGKSEVFSFTVMPDSVAKIISSAPYIKLDMNNPQTTIMHQGVLKMEYFNATGDSTVKAEVFLVNEKTGKRTGPLSFNLKVAPGQNFLEYKINNRIRLDETAVYGVRVVNGKGEVWMMRFTAKYYF